MVKDAEAHAEEDRKFHDLVNARNQADGLVHATKKSLAELGDKVEAQERKDIEAAMEEVKAALKADDKDQLEAKSRHLAELSGKIAQRAYQAEQAASAAAGGAQTAQPSTAESGDVVDADFEEVKDK